MSQDECRKKKRRRTLAGPSDVGGEAEGGALVRRAAHAAPAMSTNPSDTEATTAVDPPQSKKSQGPKSKRWAITVNLPEDTPEMIRMVEEFTPQIPEGSYLVYQLERAETTNKLHIQGYVEFLQSNFGTAVTKIFKKFASSHNEVSKFDAQHNTAYCTKHCKETKPNGGYGCIDPNCAKPGLEGMRIDGVIPHVYGVPKESAQGTRNDLKKLRAVISEVGDMEAVLRNEELSHVTARHMPWVKAMCAIAVKDATYAWRPVETFVHIGPTGTSKTKLCESYPNHFTWQFAEKWWDGYAGESVLIIDDVRKANVPVLSEWLRLLQGNQLKLNTKGTHTYARWTQVHITSNEALTEWFPVHDKACLARLKAMYLYGDEGYKVVNFETFNRGFAPELPQKLEEKSAPADAMIYYSSLEHEDLMETPRSLQEFEKIYRKLVLPPEKMQHAYSVSIAKKKYDVLPGRKYLVTFPYS